MKELTIYGPEYLKKFKCIGSSCEESCCENWNVELDILTSEKYQSITDEDFKNIFDVHYRKYSFLKRTDIAHSCLTLTEEKRCPFLSGEKLCKIQSKYGEEYLSLTCDSFPRITNRIDDRYERCLTLACPEAARIVLFDDDQHRIMEFKEECREPFLVNRSIDTKKRALFGKSKNNFYDIRGHVVDLIYDRSIPMWERLIFVSEFLINVNTLIKKRKDDEITQLIQKGKESPNRKIIEDCMNMPESLKQRKVEIMLQFFEGMEIKKDEIKDYEEIYRMVKDGLSIVDWDDKEGIYKNYVNAYDKYYKPYFEENGYVIENYLVNQIYRDLFPFSHFGNPFFSLFALIAQYAIVKFHLVGLAAARGGLTKEDIVKASYSFSKVFSHYTPFYMNILNFFRSNRMYQFKYLACLIKED